ncbi:VCBS repeat-containing protein, partial [Candidatus Woesearchaeota archaeon]|nr:VCBS repeat-containing protein [Candidatus Woesearchaeota archaeon]
DLNNDNLKEVVIMDYASNLIVANHNGQILPNWPKLLDLPQGYEYNIPDVAPAIADIDGDGSNEIIIYSLGFSPECCNPGDSMTRVWVLNYDGTNVPGWPKDLYGFDSVLMSNIAVADLNNDNQLEIISRSYSGKLYVWNPDGTNSDLLILSFRMSLMKLV